MSVQQLEYVTVELRNRDEAWVWQRDQALQITSWLTYKLLVGWLNTTYCVNHDLWRTWNELAIPCHNVTKQSGEKDTKEPHSGELMWTEFGNKKLLITSGALWQRHFVLSSYKDPPLSSILKLAVVVFETIS
jgi:hypothetical protein